MGNFSGLTYYSAHGEFTLDETAQAVAAAIIVFIATGVDPVEAQECADMVQAYRLTGDKRYTTTPDRDRKGRAWEDARVAAAAAIGDTIPRGLLTNYPQLAMQVKQHRAAPGSDP